MVELIKSIVTLRPWVKYHRKKWSLDCTIFKYKLDPDPIPNFFQTVALSTELLALV